jgi:hypothetical protein
MKKRIIGFFSLGLLLLTNLAFADGKDFEGVIIYNISYQGDMEPEMMAMMPKTMTMKISGNNSRTEINMGMGSTVVIFNGETKTAVTLLDMMGQKYAMQMTSAEIEQEWETTPDTEVILSDETKEIAGYTCKKAIVRMKLPAQDKTSDLVVFYTNELGSELLNYNNPFYKDIEGVMLEYSMKEEEMDMSFTAIKIEKEKISSDEFSIPEGYKSISSSEFKNMFGGY